MQVYIMYVSWKLWHWWLSHSNPGFTPKTWYVQYKCKIKIHTVCVFLQLATVCRTVANLCVLVMGNFSFDLHLI
jgi:hypothetical protein